WKLSELVAQLVEQRPFKAWVLGSNPSGLTTHKKITVFFPAFPASLVRRPSSEASCVAEMGEPTARNPLPLTALAGSGDSFCMNIRCSFTEYSRIAESIT